MRGKEEVEGRTHAQAITPDEDKSDRRKGSVELVTDEGSDVTRVKFDGRCQSGRSSTGESCHVRPWKGHRTRGGLLILGRAVDDELFEFLLVEVHMVHLVRIFRVRSRARQVLT